MNLVVKSEKIDCANLLSYFTFTYYANFVTLAFSTEFGLYCYSFHHVKLQKLNNII